MTFLGVLRRFVLLSFAPDCTAVFEPGTTAHEGSHGCV